MVRSRTYQSVESLRAFRSSFHDSTPFVFLHGFYHKMPTFTPRFFFMLSWLTLMSPTFPSILQRSFVPAHMCTLLLSSPSLVHLLVPLFELTSYVAPYFLLSEQIKCTDQPHASCRKSTWSLSFCLQCSLFHPYTLMLHALAHAESFITVR